MKKIFLLLTICTFLSSCTKDKGIDGCTDSYAVNYNPNANYEDGSCLYECADPYAVNFNILSPYYGCEYEADVIFYLNEFASDYFSSMGISLLDVWVENQYVGTLNTNLYINGGIPNCTDDYGTAAVNFILAWNDQNLSSNFWETTFNWSVRDPSGFIHYNGTDLALSGNCLPMMLSLKKIQEYKQATK
tara:strand:- start:114 stop:680 length:567 start_codon:yes stop_codon:yes gene_type:complete